MIRAYLFALLAVVALSAPAAALAGDGFKVIVNSDVKTLRVSKDELSRIFLKKTTRWTDGSEIRVVQPRVEAPARRAFDPAVHKLPPLAIRAYWSQMVFSGRDVPPVERANDEAIVEFVRQNDGAVGVVSEGAAVNGVRVLEVQ
jgi:ABC-type phosphate transport system substrate-binding protein